MFKQANKYAANDVTEEKVQLSECVEGVHFLSTPGRKGCTSIISRGQFRDYNVLHGSSGCWLSACHRSSLCMESKGRPQEDLTFDISHKGKLKVLRSNRERDRHRIFQVQVMASVRHASTGEEKLCRFKGGSEERTSWCLLGLLLGAKSYFPGCWAHRDKHFQLSVLRSRCCTWLHLRSCYSKAIPSH